MKDDNYFFGKSPRIFDRNHRHLAFEVNPLEARNIPDEDAEAYHPTSRFLPSYPSFVLCEDLASSDEPERVELSKGML